MLLEVDSGQFFLSLGGTNAPIIVLCQVCC